ncbi:MAG: O-antigen ligase family protein [Candidatus Wildermuthbacteria bacterium]|nr:O-antigen ligase family protein [Candidatus Wildermuthbacteria bacterium]
MKFLGRYIRFAIQLLRGHMHYIVQFFLLAVIAVVPFILIGKLYFPYISGKAYVFRSLVAIAFFFWTLLLIRDSSILRGVKQSFRNILVVAIILFFLAQFVAAFFGVDPVYSLFSSIERADGVLQYGFWVLYFLMFVSVFREKRDWKMFFSVFTVVAVALSGYSWFNHESQFQLYGVFGNPAYFAAFLLFAIGFSLLVFERKFFYPGPVHYAFAGAAGFFILTLIFTQVRGVYVGFAGGFLLFSLLAALFLRQQNKKLVLACGGILLFGLVSLGILFAAKETEFVQKERLLYRITEVTEIWEKGSTRERLLNWSIALKAFKERPIFGYGLENYGAAANKYYDYRIGVEEPWFDRAHNQFFDTLATGGIVVFSAYLFWLLIAALFIFKIAKQQRVLGFLLASLLFAYFLQSLFLFDLMAVYLGLFPFLAFLIYASSTSGADTAGKQNTNYPAQGWSASGGKIANTRYLALVPAALISFAIIYFTAVVPYKANAAGLQFFAYTENGFYKESEPFLEEAFRINSPYTYWEVRKRAGWQLASVMDYGVNEDTDPGKIEEIKRLYELMAPELERFSEAKPYDPQMYYILSRMYRLGSNKLGFDDLDKAESVLKKGFQYSDRRVEYYNEFAQTLLAQGKAEEAERVVKEYAQRAVYFGEAFPYVTLGHFYFVSGQYEKAFEQYEKARDVGYEFFERGLEYNRYMFVAQEVKAYEEIIDMAKAFIARWGNDADSYFNIAVGYFYLGDKEQAKGFFLKAIEADPERYSEHEFKPLFLEGG